MVRAAVCLVLAMAVLGVSQGGGSEAYVRKAALTDPPEPAADPEQPGDDPPPSEPLAPITYPRFLHPLPSDAHRRSAQKEPREVLLTFDDGPDLNGTPAVLEALDRHGRKAIFFVNGRYLLGSHPIDLQRRELVRKLAAHGHLVANHTLTHRNLCRAPHAVAEEIDTNSEIIAYATGVRPLLFRSPYGARCHSLDEALKARDLVGVGWSIDPQEWRGKSSGQEAVFQYVTAQLSRLTGRGILLLHDTHPATVLALPRILDWIDEENARTARQNGPQSGPGPLRIVDYGVFVPERAIPPTGLEPVAQALVQPFRLLVSSLW